MKKILIPTDFSENAGDALDYALHLIKGQKAKIHIVNVVTPMAIPTDVAVTSVPPSQEEIVNANKAMEALESFGKAFFGETKQTNIEISTSVEIGPVAAMIKNKAKELETDIIIMGTQGSNHSFVEKVVGTISTEVIDHAACPVILVPKNYKFKPIDNVIFSTNLNHSDPYELWKATELLSPKVARVRCLYVSPNKEKENEKELEEFAKYMIEHSPTIQTIFNIVESKNVEAEITEYAENYDAELIIMHRSKKSLWKSIFSARHTKKMVFWSKVPLMILN